ncbi:MAG: TonB-dependent receptor [Prevotella sp.]|nr:TonB-dependent receptor [Prevotella sp.]
MRVGLTVLLMLFVAAVSAQDITVRGSVKDATGEPAVGATIRVQGSTTAGAVTDVNGNFTITCSPRATLDVVYIGYEPQSVAVNGRNSISVVLSQLATDLSEVVVVGYGVQKKMNLSGAVSTVKMEDVLGDRPQPNVAAALQGAIPGLYITSGSNTPGQTGKSIQIRGTASFSGSNNTVSGISPLILIDNVPGDIDALNPEDIESVTVLKDASASAIYGARAAAGVVLITTKRPKQAQKVNVNYSGTVGWVNATSRTKQVSTEEFIQVYKDAFNTNQYTGAQNQNLDDWLTYLGQYKAGTLSGVTDNGIYVAPDGLRYYLGGGDNNKRMLETGTSWNHNLAVSGATDAIRVRMSANSYKENGPLYGKKDTYNRKSINGVISADVAKWFTQELDIYYTQQKREFLQDETGALFGQRNVDFLPDGKDPLGYLIRTPRNIIDVSNVRTTLVEQPRIFTKSIFRPFKGLEAIFEYTYQRKGTDFNYSSGKYTLTDIQLNVLNGPDHDYAITRRFYESRYAINAYATYKFEPWKNHNFSVMAGFNQEKWSYSYFNTRAEDQAIIDIPSMSGAQGTVTTSDVYQEYALRSGFFRLNYDYAGKYIFEVSGRYDGSSKFPKDSRFGFFPSFSVAWNITNENFMKGTEGWLNQLKPRFSYGSIGNQTSVGYYDYISSMSLNTQANVWLSGNNNDYVTVIGVPGIVSDKFTWETITTLNVGLDFALFNNRVTGSFEYFVRKTKDILSQSVALPSVLGDDAPMQNVGAMKTNGWEFNINYRDHIGPDFSYRIGFNIWDYQSKVTKLNFNEEKSLSYLYEGKKAGEIWGYESDGFYTVDDFADLSTWTLKDGVVKVDGVSPRPGDYKFANLRDGDVDANDVNRINSGKYTANNPGDLKVIGNTTPRFQYGFNLGANYKGIDLNIMLQGVAKRDYFASGPYFYTLAASDGIWMPVFEGTTDYWKPKSTDASSPDYYVAANPNAKLPRIYGNVGNGGYNRNTNTKMLQSAAYMRVKNITLSYTFPKTLLQKVHVSNLRAYVSAENPFTFTSLPDGVDPETLSWSYPLYRTISLGLNITL